jgi:hypothetical protein
MPEDPRRPKPLQTREELEKIIAEAEKLGTTPMVVAFYATDEKLIWQVGDYMVAWSDKEKKKDVDWGDGKTSSYKIEFIGKCLGYIPDAGEREGSLVIFKNVRPEDAMLVRTNLESKLRSINLPQNYFKHVGIAVYKKGECDSADKMIYAASTKVAP